MLNTISTILYLLLSNLPHLCEAQPSLMNILGAVWSELVPVGVTLQVLPSPSRPCNCRAIQETFTLCLIK